MTYVPEHQYRCTIIRGKSQTDMEDLLPFYSNTIHSICPCTKIEFNLRANKMFSKALFDNGSYETLPDSNKKTVRNHITEIAGKLLGLYYTEYDEDTSVDIVYESESCKFLYDQKDYPTFFKNLCFNFQFPNAEKKKEAVSIEMKNEIRIKPFCYVISLLYYAQLQPSKKLLEQQEVGYYVLNNLDVLQGKVDCKTVYERIMYDRNHHIKRNKLSGSNEWQHIKEQFNLLELAYLVETNAQYIWLNKDEGNAINAFVDHVNDFKFNPYKFDDIENKTIWLDFSSEWGKYYGSMNPDLMSALVPRKKEPIVLKGFDDLIAAGGAIKSSVDLGDEGEALVYKLEQNRVRHYKERLVNKVLLLGKTKGLGYDISSIEAEENPDKPEFARYIEVKSTRRTTEPSFDKCWLDSLNLTSKEWVAAEQYGDYYYIYRVYFTKHKTIIVRIKNPFKKWKEEKTIDVFPTIYQMDFGSDTIEKIYAKEIS